MQTLPMQHDVVRIKGQRLILADIGAAILRMIGAWQARAQQRRLLLELDERMLRDIGLGGGDVARETLKHYWQR